MGVFRKDTGGRGGGAAAGPSRLDEAHAKMEEAYAALIDAHDAGEARRLLEEAAGRIEDCIRWDPDDVRALRELARVNAELGRAEAASAACRRAFKKAGDHAEALLEAAECAADEVLDYDLALEILGHVTVPLRARRWQEVGKRAAERRTALRTAPLTTDALLDLKERLLERGVVKLEGARVINLCDHEMTHTNAWLTERGLALEPCLAFLAARGGKRCDCEVLFNADPIELCDTIGRWKAFAARRAYWRGKALVDDLIDDARRAADPTAALAALDAALAVAPEDARLHVHRANALTALRRWPEALAACERGIALDGGPSFPHFLRAELLLDLERPADAAAAARAALECERRDPNAKPHAEVYHTLADALISLERWAEAERELDGGLKAHPEHAELSYLRGYARFQQQREAEARADFDVACRRAPEEGYTWYGEGEGEAKQQSAPPSEGGGAAAPGASGGA